MEIKSNEDLLGQLFEIDLYDKTVAELIEIALELDCGMYDYLPEAWRNPGISGLCALRLISDYLRRDISRCALEVRTFINAIDITTDEAIELFQKEGSQAFVKPLVNKLFQSVEGFKRITYTQDRAETFLKSIANLPKEGQLVYRESDARFFVLVDNGYIAGPNGVVQMGDLPRAAIGHAHITVNEGMKKEEGQKFFADLLREYGETDKPLYRSLNPAGEGGLRYLACAIKINSIEGIYEGIPKTNCRIVKTCHLQVQSEDLCAFAGRGLGPKLADYTYHITFCEKMRAPYPGLIKTKTADGFYAITDLLSPVGQSARFIEILRLHSNAMRGEDVRTQLSKGDKITFMRSYERRGKQLFELGSDPDALWYFTKALELATEIYGENSAQTAPYYLKLGRSYYYTTNNKKALELCEKAVENYKAIDEAAEASDVHRRGLGRAYMWLGNVYYKQERYQKALELHNASEQQRSLELGNSAILKKKLLKVIAHRGNAYFKMGDYDMALKEQKRALVLSLEVNTEVHKNTAWIIANLGVIYSKQGRRAKALEQFERIRDIYLKIFPNEHPVIYKNHIQLGQLYSDVGNWQKAVDNFQSALVIFQSKYRGKPGLIAKCYAGLAEIDFKQGKLDAAILNIQKAIDIEEVANKNSIYVVSHYVKLGEIYYLQGQFSKAINCYREKALPMFAKDSQWKENELHHQCLLSLMRALLAEAVNSKGKNNHLLNEAIEVGAKLMNDSLEVLAEEEQAPEGLSSYDFIEYCTILSMLGQLYTLDNKPAQAGELFLAQANRWKAIPLLALRWAEQAIYCFKLSPGQHQLMAQCYHLIAEITFSQRRYQYALIQLKKAIELNPCVKWEQEYHDKKMQLSTLLACIDDDLFIQLERAQETYYHLQVRYLEDLAIPGEKQLSELAKNRTTELLIKLRNILDMSYSRLIKEAIWTPNKHKIAHVYYPSQGAVKSLENELIKSEIICQPKFSLTSFKFSTGGAVGSLIKELKRCGYIDKSSKITQEALDDVNLSALSAEVSPYIPELMAEIAEINIGGTLGGEELSKVCDAAHVVLKKVTPDLIIQWLIEKGVAQRISNDEYRIADIYIPAGGALLVLPPIDEPELLRYGKLIEKTLNKILFEEHKDKKASITEGPLQDCWQTLLKEQTFSYFSEAANQTGCVWNNAWLEKLNAIQNESKHVRLTPQIMKSGFSKKKAGVNFRRVKINIEYLQSRFYSWTFIEPLRELTTHLDNVGKIRLSRNFLKFLKANSYINKQVVNHPLALALVKLKKEGAANADIVAAEQAFRAQLYVDINAYNPAWSVYAEKMCGFLLLKLLQRAKLSSEPDSFVSAPWLLETTMSKVWQQVEEFGKARLAVSKSLKNAPLIQFNLNEELDFHKKSKVDLDAEVVVHEQKFKLVAKPNNLSMLAEQHRILIRLNVLYGLTGKHCQSGDLFRAAAKAVAKDYPWLAVQYYYHAFKCYRDSLLGYDKLSYLAREGAEFFKEQRLYSQAKEFLLKAQSYLIGDPKSYVTIQEMLKNWAEEDSKRKSELDSEIDSQLRHVRETYMDALYMSFNLYINIDDDYLNQRLQNMLMEMVIKLRHLLDQAFTLFTQTCLYENKTLTLRQTDFPFANTEATLKKEILEEPAKEETDVYDEANHPFFKGVPEYQDLYQAILALQPFTAVRKTWLENIIKICNESKHERLTFPDKSMLQPLRNAAMVIEDFYPLAVSGQAIFPLLNEAYEGVESLLKIMFKHINLAVPKKDKKNNMAAAVGSFNSAPFGFFSRGVLASSFGREWYADDDINLLLDHYLQGVDNVQLLSAMQGTDWRGTNILRENLIQYHQQRLQKLELGQQVDERVVIPVNLGGRHWVLVCIRFPKDMTQLPDIHYIDPLGLCPDCEVVAALRHPSLFPGVKLIDSEGHTFQYDDYNCGPWIVEIARSFISMGVIPAEGELDIEAARVEHHDQLAIIRAAHTQDATLASSLTH